MKPGTRVINLGLPKSGTTTFGKALQEAGLRVADWRIRKGDPNARRIGFVGTLMYMGYFKKGDPLYYMPNYDAYSQVDICRFGRNYWPQSDWGLLSAIQAKHKDVKFVLSYREPVKVADSMMRWSNLGKRRLPQNEIPGLPKGFGGNEQELTRWIEGHYLFCRQVFKGADNFLEYDTTDPEAREKISSFLDLEMPWWGVANKNTRHEADDDEDMEVNSAGEA